jgi:hypothetical protein
MKNMLYLCRATLKQTPMKIELKKIKIAEHMNEETTAYTADLYVNGKCIGYVKNDGQGGDTNICCHFPAESIERKLCAEAEVWAKAQPPYSEIGGFRLPMSLDFYVDIILFEHEKAKQDAKDKRAQLKEIQWGVPNSGRYMTTSWKKVTLAELAAKTGGKLVLQSKIDTIKRDLKDGHVILNAEYLRSLGLTV